jgi:DNA-binding CsgD family transcriptional regulator
MSFEVVAREDELRAIARFLDAPSVGATALVLEGDAGIGKSTLWTAEVENARERNIPVLSCRAAEAEQGLAYAGLADLLEAELERILEALPAPRRRALEVALLLQDSGEGVDPRAVGVAARNALEVLAAEGPVLVAVDDVQWLDASSAAALSFALRRTGGRCVLLLLARRLGEQPERRELERAVGPDRVERIRLGSLSLGAIQQLLQTRLGRPLARPTLVRIHEASGGNPFYALEIGRSLGADVDPTQPLPVPETLEELLLARFDGLPEATRNTLLLVAAVGHPAKRLLASVGVTDDVLEPAVVAGVVDTADEAITFTHPLLASALYQSHTPTERRRAHEALAEVDGDPVGRARHLALSASAPDAETAAVVEAAAATALARGAPVVAAELAEHAVRLTPGDAEAEVLRRKLALPRAHVVAGDVRRARTLARDLVAALPAGEGRAEALAVLSYVEEATGAGFERAIALRREALGEPGLSTRLQAELHQWLGDMTRMTEGLAVAETHARTALRLAEKLDDDALRAGSLSVLAVLRFNGGHHGALTLAEEALERAVAAGDARQRNNAAFGLAHILVWSLELERARALLESLYEERSEHDELGGATALWYLSLAELWGSRFTAAAEYAERVEQIQKQYAIDDVDPTVTFLLQLVAAHVGDLDRAVELAERMPRRGGMGFVKFWRGETAEALEHFAAADGHDGGIRDPTMSWAIGEHAEALVEVGRIDEATELLNRWEEAASRVGRVWALARVARGRALVAAARGDVVEAQTLLERLLEKYADVEDPFGRARALLALGLVRRRARQKRAARDAIEAAVAAFEEMGAAGWAAKARAELGRIGGRTREEGLSPAEQRVAELVAEGQTNREVAEALVLGERTVETHLTHIYAKLGVRSRTEMALTLRKNRERAGKS